MIKKTYRGEPGGIVKVILPSGKLRPLRHVVGERKSRSLNSPTGFGRKQSDGYGGSGLADLALSILCDVLGERPSEKQIYYGRFKAYPHNQDFKREFVARWEYGDGFEIYSDTIAGWLRKRGVEVQP
jgi:hypothetical protein